MVIGVGSCFCQETIKLIKSNSGVYKIPCKVNGISMDFIFDTGCYNVSLSATEAMFLVKQGLLERGDILERTAFRDANGQIDSSTTIIIRRLEIGNIVLENVLGSVTDSQTAPILFGQTAIKKLGPLVIDFNNETIIVIDFPK
jgi:clan AA aspartic protease (TIGR02281 family)